MELSCKLSFLVKSGQQVRHLNILFERWSEAEVKRAQVEITLQSFHLREKIINKVNYNIGRRRNVRRSHHQRPHKREMTKFEARVPILADCSTKINS
jgi:hypothetical protein